MSNNNPINLPLVLLAVGVAGWLWLSDLRLQCTRLEAEYKAYQNAIKDARP